MLISNKLMLFNFRLITEIIRDTYNFAEITPILAIKGDTRRNLTVHSISLRQIKTLCQYDVRNFQEN